MKVQNKIHNLNIQFINLKLKITYNFLKFNFINTLIIKYKIIEYIIENV